MALKGYCSIDRVFGLLGWDINDGALKGNVELMTEFAERCVDEQCRTVFDWQPGRVVTYNGNGTAMLSLGLFLKTLTSVEVLTPTGEVDVTLSNVVPQPEPYSSQQGYRWLELRQIINTPGNVAVISPLPNIFPVGLSNIRVTGDFGYQTDEVPHSVQLAVAYTVKHLIVTREYNELIDLQSGLGRTIKFKDGVSDIRMPKVAKSLLGPFRNSTWMSE